MPPFYNWIAALLGVVCTVSVAAIFRFLRKRLLLPIAILGWLVSVFGIAVIVLYAVAFLQMRNNPLADMGPVWGILAVALTALLLYCGVAAWAQSSRSRLSWLRLFGCMVAEAGLAIAITLLLNECEYSLANLLRAGRGDGIPLILRSFNWSRQLLSAFDTGFVVTLTLWEFVHPFLSRPTIPSEPRAVGDSSAPA